MAEASQSSLAAPSFGKYRLLKRIACGGMAHIYLASIDGPEGFSKPVVVKTILPEYSGLEEFKRMFVVEAKTAALLNHGNIAHIFDFGQVGGRYYIAMEWVDGVSLDALLKAAAARQQPLGARMALAVGLAMCEALSYVESATSPDGQPLQLIHRDVTPGNILLSYQGTAKLTDFGVVKSALAKTTASGGFKGKFAYMSPEQIRAEAIDARVDVYSLGVVLYEITTGVSPFRRESAEKTMNAVLEENVAPPRSLNPDCQEGFEAILLNAIERDREQRYPGARQMLAALEAFRAEQGWTNGAGEIGAQLQELCPRSPDEEAQLRETLAGKPDASVLKGDRADGSDLPQHPLARSRPPPSATPTLEALPAQPAEPDQILTDLEPVPAPAASFGLVELLLTVLAAALANASVWLLWRSLENV